MLAFGAVNRFSTKPALATALRDVDHHELLAGLEAREVIVRDALHRREEAAHLAPVEARVQELALAAVRRSRPPTNRVRRHSL